MVGGWGVIVIVIVIVIMIKHGFCLPVLTCVLSLVSLNATLSLTIPSVPFSSSYYSVCVAASCWPTLCRSEQFV